jgi:hypothetical protein
MITMQVYFNDVNNIEHLGYDIKTELESVPEYLNAMTQCIYDEITYGSILEHDWKAKSLSRILVQVKASPWSTPYAEKTFSKVPTVSEVHAIVEGNKKTMRAQLIEIVKEEPSIIAIGFTGSDCEDVENIIAITIYAEANAYHNSVFDICDLIRSLYITINHNSNDTYTCAVFGGVDTDTFMLRKGVDW